MIEILQQISNSFDDLVKLKLCTFNQNLSNLFIKIEENRTLRVKQSNLRFSLLFTK